MGLCLPSLWRVTPGVIQVLTFSSSKTKAFLTSCNPGVMLNFIAAHTTAIRAGRGLPCWSSHSRPSERKLRTQRMAGNSSGCEHLEAGGRWGCGDPGGWWRGQGLDIRALLSLPLALGISPFSASVFLISKRSGDCKD